MASVNNPWLRGVTGKVAGMVVQGGTTRGTTIIRERVVPVDPNTTLQRVQRVIMATAGVAYSKMSEIVDHSFEGYSGKAANMNRFRSLNANMLRQFVASKEGSGVDWGKIYDFTPKGTSWMGKNNYIMSEGSLPRLPFEVTEDGALLLPTGISSTGAVSDTITYAELADKMSVYGVKLGDQITVCAIRNGKRYDNGGGILALPGFGFCRLILNGYNNDSDQDAFSIGSGNPFESGSAHRLTQLNGFTLSLTIKNNMYYIQFVPALNGEWGDYGIGGSCAILSRKVNDKWLRSPSTMVAKQETDVELRDKYMFSLSTAISNSYSTINAESDLYLNNAQQAG